MTVSQRQTGSDLQGRPDSFHSYPPPSYSPFFWMPTGHAVPIAMSTAGMTSGENPIKRTRSDRDSRRQAKATPNWLCGGWLELELTALMGGGLG